MKFLQKIFNRKKDNGICAECKALCCHHIALEIDKPTSKSSKDHIRWYLLHEGVEVFTDHSGSWFLKFATKCEKLKDTMCGIYSQRPDICRNYPGKNQSCEYEGEGEYYTNIFKTEEEFIKYMAAKSSKKRKTSPRQQ
ncbi:MAG: YkgJ family cysteine cluster protein [Spirochaetes bacterium]|nr:YkgJ family cysteine cluster protein [Spirochaetota bacterium]